MDRPKAQKQVNKCDPRVTVPSLDLIHVSKSDWDRSVSVLEPVGFSSLIVQRRKKFRCAPT